MDMTPMIDVVFQLMIFFMCTIQFKTLEGKLSAYLPKDVGPNPSDARPLDKVDVVILVEEEGTKLHPYRNALWDGEGPFRYATDRVLTYRVGTKEARDLAELSARLAVLHAATPERGLTIDARAGVVYADMVAVLDTAVLAGFAEITFKGAR
jgi:biopolymer transport protein ExbD